MSDEDNRTFVFDSPNETAQDEDNKPKAKKPAPRRRNGNITPKQVEDVLNWKTKLDQADGKIVSMVRFLVNSTDDDDYKFISKLLSGNYSNAALTYIEKEEDLLTSDDFKAGLALGSESRDARREHWELAIIADPDAARAVTGGSLDFPVSKEAYEEAGKIHELHNRINDYLSILNSVEEFLA